MFKHGRVAEIGKFGYLERLNQNKGYMKKLCGKLQSFHPSGNYNIIEEHSGY